MSYEEKTQWTLGVIAKLKNAEIGDSKKLDDMKHLLENGKTINTQQIIYLREKFDELKENTNETFDDSSSPTYTDEPNKNQSEVKSKMRLIQFALFIIIIGATLFIENIIWTVGDYDVLNVLFIGIIIIIVGGIIAVVGRKQRKKQHLSESKNEKIQTPADLLIIIIGATMFVENIILSDGYYEGDVGTVLIIGIALMIIGGIVAGIRRKQRKKQHLSESKNIAQTPIKENDAVQILKMRLAKGEITKGEFDKIKDDLKD